MRPWQQRCPPPPGVGPPRTLRVADCLGLEMAGPLMKPMIASQTPAGLASLGAVILDKIWGLGSLQPQSMPQPAAPMHIHFVEQVQCDAPECALITDRQKLELATTYCGSIF